MKLLNDYLEEVEKTTIRAGMIPYYKKDDKIFVLFMKPSDSNYGGSDFQICKGSVEPGEELLDAAIRECNEELGVKEGEFADEPKFLLQKNNINYFYVPLKEMYKKSVSDTQTIKDDNGNDVHEAGEIKWLEIPKEIEKITNWQRWILNIFIRKVK